LALTAGLRLGHDDVTSLIGEGREEQVYPPPAHAKRGDNSMTTQCNDSRLAMNVGVGLALGASVGVGIGAALGNIGVGIAIGVAVGTGIGAALGGRKGSE
jgi:hypothetical protein